MASKLVVTTLVCVKLVINFMAICASGEKILQEATGIRRGQIYIYIFNFIHHIPGAEKALLV